ncbi:MAG: hypothetical protein SPL47_09065 [Bacteroidales bacterium]|nr:hypothetical protein [Bacteroidales bacterium]
MEKMNQGQYFKTGLNLYNQGDYLTAIEFFQAEIDNFSHNETAYLYLSKCYKSIGKELEHRKTLFRLLSINPDNQEAMKELSVNFGSENMVFNKGASLNTPIYYGYIDDKKQPHKYGTFIRPDGTVYSGCILHGTMYGEGIMKSSNGAVVISHFNDDVVENGLILLPCGTKIEGYLKNSLPCGRCTITLSNGIIIEGTFHGSELDSKEECTVIDNTGKALTGHFINKVFVPTNKDADKIDAELVASIIKCWPNIQF